MVPTSCYTGSFWFTSHPPQGSQSADARNSRHPRCNVMSRLRDPALRPVKGVHTRHGNLSGSLGLGKKRDDSPTCTTESGLISECRLRIRGIHATASFHLALAGLRGLLTSRRAPRDPLLSHCPGFFTWSRCMVLRCGSRGGRGGGGFVRHMMSDVLLHVPRSFLGDRAEF